MATLARRLAREDKGFTLVELMVAISVLAVGIVGLVKTFDGSRDLNTISERLELMTNVAERYMEQLHDMPFDGLALASPLPANAPAHRANQYVCSGSTFDWDRNGCASTVEPLVTPNAGITGIQSSADWYDERTGARGTVHRFISWVDETCAGGCDAANGRDYKRITVFVLLGQGKPQTPVVLQGYAYDTERRRVCDPLTGGSGQCG